MKLHIATDESGAAEEVELTTLDRLNRTRETEHYVFRYAAGSLAEREMDAVTAEQEKVYDELIDLFGFALPMKIEYFLTDSPEENGAVLAELIGMEQGPTNGLCLGPNYVFGAYSKAVKCVGHHEVTHLFSYRLCMPKSQFLSEGLAVYSDGTFWGRPNAAWVRKFLETGAYVSVRELAFDEVFYATPTEISYPTAGAFTAFLIDRLGVDTFLHTVYPSEVPLFENLAHLFGCRDAKIEQQFEAYCQEIK